MTPQSFGLAYAFFLLTVAVVLMTGLFVVRHRKRRPFKVVPYDEPGGDEWGKMFAIVDRSGKVVGLDRYQTALQRCAAMNDAARETSYTPR